MSSRIVQGSKLRTNRKLRRVSLYLIKIKEKQTIKVEGKMTKLNWDGRLQLHQLQTTTVRLLTTSTCTRCDHRLGSEKINVRGLRRDDQFRIEAGSQSSSEKKKRWRNPVTYPTSKRSTGRLWRRIGRIHEKPRAWSPRGDWNTSAKQWIEEAGADSRRGTRLTRRTVGSWDFDSRLGDSPRSNVRASVTEDWILEPKFFKSDQTGTKPVQLEIRHVTNEVR